MAEQGMPQLPPPFQISRMIMSLWVPQAIYSAASLGVADALAEGPRTSADVARTVGAEPGTLHRLLRALVTLELLQMTDAGAFALTPLGACLRSDARDSVRAWVLLMGGEMVWKSWGRLGECVRTGRAVPALDGTERFAAIDADPAAAAVFDESMVQLTRHIAGAFAAAYDFSGIRTLVDVGGGHGALLPPVLAANPDLRGVVFDRPRCREGALRLFAKTRIAERCDFVPGDFFATVAPAGADAYVLKSVIHDWNDEESLVILGNCRRAMREGARLLVFEPIVPDRPGTSPYDAMIAATDLNMMVVTGGRERTEREFRELLQAAGFRVTRLVPTPATFTVIEAVPA
jgi:SAM-dependent methyltransferase